jgi:protease-4
MGKVNKSGLYIFIAIIVIALAVTALSLIGVERDTPQKRLIGPEYVAVLNITGVIEEANRSYNQEWLLRTIGLLKDDRKNLGILLFIDSPGGSVYESDDAYLALEDYAASGKPLWAYLGSVAASGGYYIACAADTIAANRNTLTGSIGVISAQSVDLTGLFDQYGVSVTTITAGKNKNMLNFNSPLTEEQRAIMQGIADECYEQFVGIVAESRGLPVDEVKTLADGRVYTASQAQKLRLIDGIASFDQTLNDFLGSFTAFRDGKPKKIDTVYYHYEAGRTFTDFFIKSAAPDPLSAKLLPNIRYPAYYYRQ